MIGLCRHRLRQGGRLRRQIDNFSRATAGEEQLLITAEDALASVEVIEAAYAALRENRWTAVSRKEICDHPKPSEELIIEVRNVA